MCTCTFCLFTVRAVSPPARHGVTLQTIKYSKRLCRCFFTHTTAQQAHQQKSVLGDWGICSTAIPLCWTGVILFLRAYDSYSQEKSVLQLIPVEPAHLQSVLCATSPLHNTTVRCLLYFKLRDCPCSAGNGGRCCCRRRCRCPRPHDEGNGGLCAFKLRLNKIERYSAVNRIEILKLSHTKKRWTIVD